MFFLQFGFECLIINNKQTLKSIPNNSFKVADSQVVAGENISDFKNFELHTPTEGQVFIVEQDTPLQICYQAWLKKLKQKI